MAPSTLLALALLAAVVTCGVSFDPPPPSRYNQPQNNGYSPASPDPDIIVSSGDEEEEEDAEELIEDDDDDDDAVYDVASRSICALCNLLHDPAYHRYHRQTQPIPQDLTRQCSSLADAAVAAADRISTAEGIADVRQRLQHLRNRIETTNNFNDDRELRELYTACESVRRALLTDGSGDFAMPRQSLNEPSTSQGVGVVRGCPPVDTLPESSGVSSLNTSNVAAASTSFRRTQQMDEGVDEVGSRLEEEPHSRSNDDHRHGHPGSARQGLDAILPSNRRRVHPTVYSSSDDEEPEQLTPLQTLQQQRPQLRVSPVPRGPQPSSSSSSTPYRHSMPQAPQAPRQLLRPSSLQRPWVRSRLGHEEREEGAPTAAVAEDEEDVFAFPNNRRRRTTSPVSTVREVLADITNTQPRRDSPSVFGGSSSSSGNHQPTTSRQNQPGFWRLCHHCCGMFTNLGGYSADDSQRQRDRQQVITERIDGYIRDLPRVHASQCNWRDARTVDVLQRWVRILREMLSYLSYFLARTSHTQQLALAATIWWEFQGGLTQALREDNHLMRQFAAQNNAPLYNAPPFPRTRSPEPRASEPAECHICMDLAPTVALIPCGHTFCEPCIRHAPNAGKCLICQRLIDDFVNIYL